MSTNGRLAFQNFFGSLLISPGSPMCSRIVFAYRASAGTAALTSEIVELRGFDPESLPEVRADQRGLIERHAAAAIAWAQSR